MKSPKQSFLPTACLAALSIASLAILPAQGAEPNPSAWRFRSFELPAAPQTITVSHGGGQGWFTATDQSGKKLRISLPPKHSWVQHAGQWVPTWTLRAGDQVEVWGVQHGGRFQAARVRMIDRFVAAEQTPRPVR